jgi:hypothetical protein
MSALPVVVIVMARCRHSRQPYGIRFEETARGQWSANWAFALKETAARREGYDRTEIVGALFFGPAYPGCPYCHAARAFKCRCEQVGCWDGGQQEVICPGCGDSIQLGGEVDRVRGGHDR